MENSQIKDDDYYKSDDFSFFKSKKLQTSQKINEEKPKSNIKTSSSNKSLSELSDEEKSNFRKNKNLNVSNEKFYSGNTNTYVKSIKESNRAIYQEPIPNFDGYFSKSKNNISILINFK
jgi:hypothetical protein